MTMGGTIGSAEFILEVDTEGMLSGLRTVNTQVGQITSQINTTLTHQGQVITGAFQQQAQTVTAAAQNVERQGSIVQQTFRQIAEVTGQMAQQGGVIGGALNAVSSAFTQASNTGVLPFVGGLNSVLRVFGAFTVATTAIALVNQLADALRDAAAAAQQMADETQKLQLVTGASTEEASTQLAIWERFGINSALVIRSFTTLSQAVRAYGDANVSAGQGGAEALQKLGVSLTDNEGKQRSLIAIQNDVIKALRDMKDPAEANATAIAILGRSYSTLAELMTNTDAEMERYGQHAKTTNELNKAATDALIDWKQAGKDVDESLRGLQNRLALLVAGPLTGFVRGLDAALVMIIKVADGIGALTGKLGEVGKKSEELPGIVTIWPEMLLRGLLHVNPALGVTLDLLTAIQRVQDASRAAEERGQRQRDQPTKDLFDPNKPIPTTEQLPVPEVGVGGYTQPDRGGRPTAQQVAEARKTIADDVIRQLDKTIQAIDDAAERELAILQNKYERALEFNEKEHEKVIDNLEKQKVARKDKYEADLNLLKLAQEAALDAAEVTHTANMEAIEAEKAAADRAYQDQRARLEQAKELETRAAEERRDAAVKAEEGIIAARQSVRQSEDYETGREQARADHERQQAQRGVLDGLREEGRAAQESFREQGEVLRDEAKRRQNEIRGETEDRQELHDSIMDGLEARREGEQERHEKMMEGFEDETDALRDQHKVAMEGFDDRVDDANRQHDDRMEAIEAESDALAAQSREQQDAIRDQIEATRDAYDARIEALRDESEAIREAADERLDTLREEAEAIRDLAADQIEAIREQNDALREQYDERRQAIEDQKDAEHDLLDDRLAAIDAEADAQSALIEERLAAIRAEDEADREAAQSRSDQQRLQKATEDLTAAMGPGGDPTKILAAQQALADAQFQIGQHASANAREKEADDLQAKLDAIKQAADAQKKALEDEQKLKDEAHAADLKKLKDELEAALKANDDKIKLIGKERDDKLDAIADQIDAIETERDAALDAIEDVIDALEDERDAALKVLEDRLEAIQKLDRANDEALQRRKKQLDDELEAELETIDGEREAAKTAHELRLAAIEKRADAEKERNKAALKLIKDEQEAEDDAFKDFRKIQDKKRELTEENLQIALDALEEQAKEEKKANDKAVADFTKRYEDEEFKLKETRAAAKEELRLQREAEDIQSANAIQKAKDQYEHERLQIWTTYDEPVNGLFRKLQVAHDETKRLLDLRSIEEAKHYKATQDAIKKTYESTDPAAMGLIPLLKKSYDEDLDSLNKRIVEENDFYKKVQEGIKATYVDVGDDPENPTGLIPAMKKAHERQKAWLEEQKGLYQDWAIDVKARVNEVAEAYRTLKRDMDAAAEAAMRVGRGPSGGGGGGGGPPPGEPLPPEFIAQGEWPGLVPTGRGTPTSAGTHGGHPAVDIFAPEGDPILAPVGGVSRTGYYRDGGNATTLFGDDGRFYYFGHAMGPMKGGRVAKYEQIGQVGRTGNAYKDGKGAPHLHFAMASNSALFGQWNGSGDIVPSPSYWWTGPPPAPMTGGGIPIDVSGPTDPIDVGTGRDPNAPAPIIRAYVEAEARERGIDPLIAAKVVQGEGNFEPMRVGRFNTGWSFWPFQLHYGGPAYPQFGKPGESVAGMGNDFTKGSGMQPGDPSVWGPSTEYALTIAKQQGWGPPGGWYGAHSQGITGFMGITKFAEGGMIEKPTLLIDANSMRPYGMMAEAGREWIVPERSLAGSATTPFEGGSSTGAPAATYNFNVTGPSMRQVAAHIRREFERKEWLHQGWR